MIREPRAVAPHHGISVHQRNGSRVRGSMPITAVPWQSATQRVCRKRSLETATTSMLIRKSFPNGLIEHCFQGCAEELCALDTAGIRRDDTNTPTFQGF